MQIPQVFEETLKASPAHLTLVNTVIEHITPWLNNSATPFFPEYTDHSLTHLEEVLQTAEDIATPEALEHLSAHDIAVLTIAICLHDCAMHLTEDGFQSLISPNSHWKPIEQFDKKSWHQLWVDFIAEARRFDGRTLLAIFGNTDPIQRPSKEIIDWTTKDKLLIGEFIRRYHTRLAHEIALFGIPGVDGTTDKIIDTNQYLESADLAGLIARSHGFSLRSGIDYLENKYNIREFDNVHAVYLMVLLRIADHLQIQKGRADSKILKLKKLKSPISRGEWRVHDCIRNITSQDSDPESIYIDARPKDIDTYLLVKKWLASMQNELDLSWAVLSEVYGRFDGKVLGMILRRVRSSLDDDKQTSQQFNFIPEKIAFDAANTDLLKLLVGPLYNDESGIGIRELTQNSVDAVRELEDLIEQRPKIANIQRRIQKADVIIHIELDENKQPAEITISDRGVGMNLEVVRDYFLKAGASFRNSETWKQQHEDEENQSRVLRSGRFGVGALAAFLIGDEIEVITRHAEAEPNEALHFTAKLDEEALTITKTNADVGTSIKIIIPKDMREDAPNIQIIQSRKKDIYKNTNKYELGNKLDYYTLSDPNLVVTSSATNEEVAISNPRPSLKDEFSYPWRFINSEKYSGIHWCCNDRIYGTTCNGINIEDTPMLGLFPTRNSLLSLNSPAISIFDSEGNLPLDLQRRFITNISSFENDLIKSIVNDFIAHALVNGPESKNTIKSKKWIYGSHLAVHPDKGVYSRNKGVFESQSHWAVSNSGFTLNSELIFNHCNARQIFTAFTNSTETEVTNKGIISNLATDQFINTIGNFEHSLNHSKACLKYIFRIYDSWRNHEHPNNRLPNSRAIIKNSVLEEVLTALRLNRHLRQAINGAVVDAKNENWTIYRLRSCPNDELPPVFSEIMKQDPKGLPIAYLQVHLPEKVDASKIDWNELESQYLEVLTDPIIPWNIDKRQKKFADVYRELAPYINHYNHENELETENQKSKSDDD